MTLAFLKPKSRFGQIKIYIPDDNKLWEDFSSRAIKELLLLNLPAFIVKENVSLTLDDLYLYNTRILDYRYIYKYPLAYLFHSFKLKCLIRKWNKQGIKVRLVWEV